MNFKKIKLTKTGITGRIPEGLHPNGIEPGHVEIGYMLNPPKVGESFLLYPYNRGFFSNFPFLEPLWLLKFYLNLNLEL